MLNSFLKMDTRLVIENTRQWISNMVIELGLCPFAERVFVGEKIRYFETEASNNEVLAEKLEIELQYLASAPRETTETTLFIFPLALSNFLDFNDFTATADESIGNMGLRGTIQIAGFHPLYRFEGTLEDSPENYTNRSPYPMLHLLREQSISELNASEEELLQIPKRNIESLKKLGLNAILERLKKLK